MTNNFAKLLESDLVPVEEILQESASFKVEIPLSRYKKQAGDDASLQREYGKRDTKTAEEIAKNMISKKVDSIPFSVNVTAKYRTQTNKVSIFNIKVDGQNKSFIDKVSKKVK